MKKTILAGTIMLVAGTLFAADNVAKEEVKGAIAKLKQAGNYSWKSTVEMGGGGGRFGGPTLGKTERDGLVHLSMTRGENNIDVVLKDGKGAMRTAEGWQTLDEVGQAGGGGQGNPGRFMARTLQDYKAPAVQVDELLSKVQDISKEGDAYVARLTDEAVRETLTFGRRAGGEAPRISGTSGTVKFWLKDGGLTKYQIQVAGTVVTDGNIRDVERTTTVEISDVGTTKLDVPEAAKQKVS
jgi:hypothetical protein